MEILAALLDLTSGGPPRAEQIEGRLSGLTLDRATAGPNLAHPAWAHGVRGADEVFLSLDGDVEGVQVWDDSRGWGAYAELAVRRGSLGEIESLVGPTSPMPRAPDDFTSGEKVAAYVDRAGWTVRVFAELARDGSGLRRVTVSYPSPDTPPRQEAPPAVVRPAPPAAGTGEPCPNCGAGTTAGSFCGSCGAYLDW
jgi:hypothetical protein